jgi:CBS domain-containing protein
MTDFKTLLSVKKFVSTKFAKAKESDTITQGAKKMGKENVTCLLVYKGKSLNGIVTESDIIRKVIAGGHDPKKTDLKTAMTPDIVYVGADESLFDARKKMETSGVRHLVVKEEDNIIGTISVRELAGGL